MSEPVNAMRQSPAEREAAKTHAERAEDVSYTINHAISCGTNDMFIAPTISALFGVQVGCSDPSHDHGAHGHHDHTPPHDSPRPHEQASYAGHKYVFVSNEPVKMAKLKPLTPRHTHAPIPKRFSWKIYRSEAFHYLRGEIIGDALAVPLTIATQRFFPSLMGGIQQLVEPVAAPFFRRGANAAAKKWGAHEGLAADAPEVIARAEAMYHNEIRHLPQAVMWNVFAFPIGVVTQRMGGHGSSYRRIIRNKSIGALISNALLLGGRALAPNIAQHWDAMNSEHIIAPVSELAGDAIGIKRTGAATAQQSWATRMERTQDTSTTATRAP